MMTHLFNMELGSPTGAEGLVLSAPVGLFTT